METSSAPMSVSATAALLREQNAARVLTPKLRALADETRLTLMLLIAERSRTVKELQEATGLSQTLVSHHLGLLREQELVEAVAEGRSNRYTVCCSALTEPVRLLSSLAGLAPNATGHSPAAS
ncbi:ArsR/SmtB family transcription factor [Actinoplanes sp. RD1]|uniref:ArsR/SmtB family transcription factor n=1 Tax=Actinoplanes sp. RD1 TaxID=3064538 RepID=UPI0027415745|nr:metalloregulator ArsR/SmtB family transcription factor [Actinoplanes sp. RD1]